MYKPVHIANWFIGNVDEDAGDLMTHLKLQKLVYYAQAWSLAVREEPLFLEDFQAWTHGPVLPSLFHYLKRHGHHPIGLIEEEGEMIDLNPEDEEFLSNINRFYGKYTAKGSREVYSF